MYNSYNNHYNSQYYGAGQGSAAGSSQRGNIMARMDETAAVALLQHLGKEDLQHLMSDDSKLSDLIQDLAQVRSIQSDHDDLVAQNKSLAEYNLSLQPQLDGLKTQVATGYENINKLKTELGMHKARLDEFVGTQKLDTLHALLQTAAAEVEEESEELANEFCEQNVSVEDFLARYIPSRTAGHKRRIKAEKMGELLREGRQSSSWPSHGQSGPSVAAPYPTGPPGGPAPYPVNAGFGMPQPNLYRP